MPPIRYRRDCYIGIDLGTSGCRAIAVDDAGAIVAEAREALPDSRHPEPGASEQDPQDWWEAVSRVLVRMMGQRAGQLRALSVDGTSATLLLCDAQGTPCAPALMYDDTRASAPAALIGRHAPTDSPARGPGSALAKLLWLLQSPPDAQRVRHALHQADWILGRLSGVFGLSDENNSLKLGYDPVARQWPAWMNALAIPPGLLPRVQAVGSILGPVAPDVAGHLGLPRDTLLVAGTTDSNAATLAAGIERPGDAVSSLGSTLVLKVLGDRPVASARYGVYSHRIGDQWLVGGASNCGGRSLRQHFTDRELHELSRQIDPCRPLGLHYYPLPGVGERFPRNDPGMQPRMQPRPADRATFLQAILEGIADVEAEGYARLAELGAGYPERVFSSGGGAINENWRKIRERRLGLPVLRAAQTEAAYGAALLARHAIRRRSATQLAE
jgi:sugar (pentulose or hexulose) kinase